MHGSRDRLEALAELLLHRLPLTLAALLLLGAIAINFANVVARYLLLASIYWADEAMVFLVIWSMFLAAVAVTYDGSQLTMDLFLARLPLLLQRVLNGAIAAVSPRRARVHGGAGGHRIAHADAQRPALDRARHPDGDPARGAAAGFVLMALAVIARAAICGAPRPAKPMTPDDLPSLAGEGKGDGRRMSHDMSMTWTMTLLPIVLLVLGFPIFVILLATSAVVIVLFYSIPPTALHQVMFGALDSSPLLAVPFFIFAGEIMGYGGISRRLVAGPSRFWARAGRACRSPRSGPASCSARSPARRRRPSPRLAASPFSRCSMPATICASPPA